MVSLSVAGTPRAELAVSRQTFVRRCHGGWLKRPAPGRRGPRHSPVKALAAPLAGFSGSFSARRALLPASGNRRKTGRRCMLLISKAIDKGANRYGEGARFGEVLTTEDGTDREARG